MTWKTFKVGAWSVSAAGYLYGITERSFASIPNGVDAIEVTQLVVASFFFFCLLVLKP